MKIHKLSILGAIVGVIVIGCSIGRWFFMWPDYSQMSLGISIGLIICGFAYIYNWMRNQDGVVTEQNKRIDAFIKWWTKKEVK